VIVIEGAERFGLSQLHQLRGRVLRGTHQPYAYVFTDSTSQTSIERLKALKTAKNGFELAEHDLRQRGAGELGGLKQWGISDIGMEAIKNLKMVEAARTEAVKIIETDPELKKYPKLSKRLESSEQKIHFE
jgi:ATP-dependent DNA helicase RecG